MEGGAEMSAARQEKITEIALKVDRAIRDAIATCQPVSPAEMSHGLSAALSLIVSYESMQAFLDDLARCADAKERVRAISAGEVPEMH
jgi:hypothetical protein